MTSSTSLTLASRQRLNITNGDSAAGTMSEAGVEGKIIAWRDVLHEGPVDSSLPLEELSKQRTGPIADVLYSAAGNSADDMYYRKGLIGYSFEAGAQRMTVNSTTGAISKTDVGFQPCFAGPGTRTPGA